MKATSRGSERGISTVGRPPKRKISIPICRCRTTALPVPAITKQINGGANQFDCLSWHTSEENFSPLSTRTLKARNSGLGWISAKWIDYFLFPQAFPRRILRQRVQDRGNPPLEGAHFYIQDGQGGWIERPSGPTARWIWAKLRGASYGFHPPLFCNESGVPAARWG